MSQSCTSKGIGRQGIGSFCKGFLCFKTKPVVLCPYLCTPECRTSSRMPIFCAHLARNAGRSTRSHLGAQVFSNRHLYPCPPHCVDELWGSYPYSCPNKFYKLRTVLSFLKHVLGGFTGEFGLRFLGGEGEELDLAVWSLASVLGPAFGPMEAPWMNESATLSVTGSVGWRTGPRPHGSDAVGAPRILHS